MTKQLINSQSRYLITPSLINSWLWIWHSAEGVVEAQSDKISLEDKQSLAIEKAKEDFLNSLNRIKSEPNQYMLEGIAYEEECYKGNTECSPIIQDGCFQAVGTKEIEVDGIKFLMYGRLDVLKGGKIYDIKRVWKYSPPKYQWSSQHQFYLELFPNTTEFQYLIWDGKKLHIEIYHRDESPSISVLIHNFMKWLKENNLLDLYFEKWQSLGKE